MISELHDLLPDFPLREKKVSSYTQSVSCFNLLLSLRMAVKSLDPSPLSSLCSYWGAAS